MNEIIKAMKERRSIRKFKADMPAKEDLEQIIEAGLYAANGMGKQALCQFFYDLQAFFRKKNLCRLYTPLHGTDINSVRFRIIQLTQKFLSIRT